MNVDVLIPTVMGLLILIVLYLRTNIALATFALGVGYILADVTAQSLVSTLVDLGIRPDEFPIEATVRIVLLALPSVVILLRFRRFQEGRFIEHIVPAVFYALLAVLLVLVNLPFALQQELRDNSYVYGQFEYFRTAIVLGAAFIAMFDVMVHEKKLVKKGKRSRGRKD